MRRENSIFLTFLCKGTVSSGRQRGNLAQAVLEVTVVILRLKNSLNVGAFIPRQVDTDLQRHLWMEVQIGGNFQLQWEGPKKA